MKHVSIQTEDELLDNFNKYSEADTNGREPDKDYICKGYRSSILHELVRRARRPENETAEAGKL